MSIGYEHALNTVVFIFLICFYMYLDSSWRIVFPMAMIGYVFDVSVGQGYLKEKKKKKKQLEEQGSIK